MKLYYEEHSALSKNDTLFLHGNLASHKWWQPMLKEWKSMGSLGKGSLIFSDWRGCGKNSDWAKDKSFSIRDLAEEQLQLLESTGREQVALVGHSLGGLIALQMMILAPKRVTKAVLLDSVGVKGVIFDDSMYDAFKQMAASFELTRMVILSTVLNGESLPEDFKEEIAKDAHKAVQGIGTSVLEILKTVDLTDEVKAISTPILLLHGRKDQIIPVADSEMTSRLLPNATLEVLPDQGHCWNIEQPHAFTERIRQWL